VNPDSHYILWPLVGYFIPTVPKRLEKLKSTVSDAEYQRFAEQFVELIVDPKQEWMVLYLMTGGFDQVPTDDEVESGKFALKVLNRLERGETQLIEVSLYEALTTGDREVLVPHTKEWATAARLTDVQMRLLLRIGKSSFLRQSHKQLGSRFRFHRGPKAKLALSQYHKVLERAEQLRPAIEKVLTELASPTAHTLSEILKYYEKDYPEPCKFLLRHLARFQQAFNEKRVMDRAKKRISARARVLADAMAGTEYDLAFSTSIERVRQARRFAPRRDSL
jgi:hypothetical protein